MTWVNNEEQAKEILIQWLREKGIAEEDIVIKRCNPRPDKDDYCFEFHLSQPNGNFTVHEDGTVSDDFNTFYKGERIWLE